MAKYCYIELLEGSVEESGKGKNKSQILSLSSSRSGTISAILVDDITVEYKSSFESFSDVLPQLSDLINAGTTLQASTTGTVNANWLRLTNLFDLPRWKRTDPIRLTLKIVFFTKDNPFKDVWEPIKKLVALTILTKDLASSSWIVPGISLATASDFSKAKGKKSPYSPKSKLISFEIPGIIYIPVAMVESAVPTYSSEETESGYPLWGSLDLSILSIYPAILDYLDLVETRTTKKNSLQGTPERTGERAR